MVKEVMDENLDNKRISIRGKKEQKSKQTCYYCLEEDSSDAMEEKHHPYRLKSSPLTASRFARRAAGSRGALGAITHRGMWLCRSWKMD